jgi:hypothetical protein
VSDEKPDCCECRLERLFLRGWSDEPALAHGGNLGNEPLGGRPLKYFWHGDWCKHRPTKALVGVAHNTVAPNGTVRVFVEGANDFSKYVWAEMEYQAAVLFPALDARYHTSNGEETTGGAYGSAGPIFGEASDSFVYQARNLQDDEGYLTSPWPLTNPGEGTRCVIRWGYREDGDDTEISRRVFPQSFFSGSPLNFIGAVVVGCDWNDIASPNESDNVRCGVELLGEGFFGNSGDFLNIARFGRFTLPFEMPRSFFVDESVEGGPKPPMPYRLVGVEATAPRVTTAAGTSTNLEVASHESVVTCGSRRSAVFIAPSNQSLTGILPAGPVGPATVPQDGIIRNDMALFVRRPDLMERSYNHVANGDSWHATHLVRFGSSLAERNALHNLHIEIEPCTFPHGIPNIVNADGVTPLNRFLTRNSDNTQRFTARYITPSPLRTALNWTIEGSAFSQSKGPRVSLLFAEDVFEPFDENPLPPAWAWDSMAGQHTLAPFAPPAGEESESDPLVPNAYHVFHEEPFQDVTVPLEEPSSDDVDRFWDIGPMTDAQFAAYEAEEYPNRTADYRLEIAFESYPQIWATTDLSEEWQRVGPREISLEDSGMTTENYDGYSGAGHRVDYVRENAGVTVTVRARVGLRTHITKVRGYRREREKVPTDLGWLRYKIPVGKCERIVNGIPVCDVQRKRNCADIANSTWTRDIACNGEPVGLVVIVSKTVTEAQAEAEFEREQEDNEAYDYSWQQGIRPIGGGGSQFGGAGEAEEEGEEIPTLRRPTGNVVVRGDHDCDDVACDEGTFEFKIPLTGEEVAAISAGQEVTKQLLAGTVQVEPDENGDPVFENVFRTVKIRVSTVGGEE